MTVLGHVVPVGLVWVLAVLAACGLWAAVWQVASGLQRAWDWWRDRREPLGEPPPSHPVWRNRLVERETERLLDLPPERSAGELGFTGEQPAYTPETLRAHIEGLGGTFIPAGEDSRVRTGANAPGWLGAEDSDSHPSPALAASRERRAPWWEAEHRAAYQSLGLDYPSGLLARVREAGQ